MTMTTQAHLQHAPPLTRAQEGMLVQRARAGEDVRDDILLSLQRRLWSMASHLIRAAHALRLGLTLEADDLVSEANLALLGAYDRALSKENPWGYLVGVAKIEMVRCFHGYHDLITTRHEQDSISVLSLDKPMTEDGATLADLLPCELRLESQEARHERERLRTHIHHTVNALPDKQRLVVQRHYGLEGAPESLNQISQRLSRRKPVHASNAYYHHKLALQALHDQLSPIFPQYCVEEVLHL